MSVMQKMVTTIARYMPDAAPDPLKDAGGYIGRPLNRVDGPLKVTGGARFTAEYAPEGLAHAVLVCSTIANGRIAAIDTTVAEAAPGVVGVLTYRNTPRMKAPSLFDVSGQGQGCAPSDLPIMQDDSVRWNGQPVAVVIADTLEQAEFAATLVTVDYASEPARVSFDKLKADAVYPPTSSASRQRSGLATPNRRSPQRRFLSMPSTARPGTTTMRSSHTPPSRCGRRTITSASSIRHRGWAVSPPRLARSSA